MKHEEQDFEQERNSNCGFKEEVIAKQIAITALNHYNHALPQKGKPTPNKEWTVYAAIVAHDQNDGNFWTVSCATGTKCTAVCSATKSHFSKIDFQNDSDAKRHEWKNIKESQLKGMILHDSHAEVLSRRGLMKVFMDEIRNDLQNYEMSVEQQNDDSKKSQTLLKRIGDFGKDSEISYALRDNMQLCLYISDSPCGDASIYDIAPEYNLTKGNNINGGSNFTGAKIIFSGDDKNEIGHKDGECIQDAGNNTTHLDSNGVVRIAREKDQITSALRLKSGRSNLPSHLRSYSMSCSDKICKWILIGMQGSGVLSHFFTEPITLSHIVVSQDKRAIENSQVQALDRALVSRAQKTLDEVVESTPGFKDLRETNIGAKVYICEEIFTQSKSSAELRDHEAKVFKSQKQSENSENPIKKRKLNETIDNPDKAALTTKASKGESSIGVSINWQSTINTHDTSNANDVEQTIGAKGVKQGKKPKTRKDVVKCASRLSRFSLMDESMEILKLLSTRKLCTPSLSFKDIDDHIFCKEIPTITYQNMKKISGENKVQQMKKMLFHSSTKNHLSGWVKSSEENDFVVL